MKNSKKLIFGLVTAAAMATTACSTTHHGIKTQDLNENPTKKALEGKYQKEQAPKSSKVIGVPEKKAGRNAQKKGNKTETYQVKKVTVFDPVGPIVDAVKPIDQAIYDNVGKHYIAFYDKFFAGKQEVKSQIGDDFGYKNLGNNDYKAREQYEFSDIESLDEISQLQVNMALTNPNTRKLAVTCNNLATGNQYRVSLQEIGREGSAKLYQLDCEETNGEIIRKTVAEVYILRGQDVRLQGGTETIRDMNNRVIPDPHHHLISTRDSMGKRIIGFSAMMDASGKDIMAAYKEYLRQDRDADRLVQKQEQEAQRSGQRVIKYQHPQNKR